MSIQHIPEPFITEEEYIRREREAETKSEYWNGRIYAMSGAAPAHNEISGNTICELGNQLRGRKCTVYTSDQRIRVEETGLNTYPDVSVVCGEKMFAAIDSNALINPILLVEVLSPSTADYDRTTKFDHYKRIPSFTDYLLVHASQVRVEHYSRQGDNAWVQTVATRLDAVLYVPTLDIALSVAEIYRNLDLPELNLLHRPSEE
jgi:Uma2 family endonuclease